MNFFYSSVNEDQKKSEKLKARKLRASQWWKQKLASGLCHYCEQKFSKIELTMDHKIPISRGGRSTKGNIVVCCKDCNNAKKNSTPADMALQELNL